LVICTAILLVAMALSATAGAAENIAFVRGGNIWMMDFDGQHQRALTTSADCASRPGPPMAASWSTCEAMVPQEEPLGSGRGHRHGVSVHE